MAFWTLFTKFVAGFSWFSPPSCFLPGTSHSFFNGDIEVNLKLIQKNYRHLIFRILDILQSVDEEGEEGIKGIFIIEFDFIIKA